jgi:hypothetical protein
LPRSWARAGSRQRRHNSARRTSGNHRSSWALARRRGARRA